MLRIEKSPKPLLFTLSICLLLSLGVWYALLRADSGARTASTGPLDSGNIMTLSDEITEVESDASPHAHASIQKDHSLSEVPDSPTLTKRELKGLVFLDTSVDPEDVRVDVYDQLVKEGDTDPISAYMAFEIHRSCRNASRTLSALIDSGIEVSAFVQSLQSECWQILEYDTDAYELLLVAATSGIPEAVMLLPHNPPSQASTGHPADRNAALLEWQEFTLNALLDLRVQEGNSIASYEAAMLAANGGPTVMDLDLAAQLFEEFLASDAGSITQRGVAQRQLERILDP